VKIGQEIRARGTQVRRAAASSPGRTLMTRKLFVTGYCFSRNTPENRPKSRSGFDRPGTGRLQVGESPNIIGHHGGARKAQAASVKLSRFRVDPLRACRVPWQNSSPARACSSAAVRRRLDFRWQVNPSSQSFINHTGRRGRTRPTRRRGHMVVHSTGKNLVAS
jgi:hypothetical protein